MTGNMLFGLGGTQELSLPMLTVLRRFSILMTMIGEFYLLKIVADLPTQLSVYLMIFGAILAAVNDLAFNLRVRSCLDVIDIIHLFVSNCYRFPNLILSLYFIKDDLTSAVILVYFRHYRY